MNRDIRDEIWVFEFSFLVKTFHLFFQKRFATGIASPWLRRFSQSKFHFDFEDDLPLGLRRIRS
jgi:hypothetical protein